MLMEISFMHMGGRRPLQRNGCSCCCSCFVVFVVVFVVWWCLVVFLVEDTGEEIFLGLLSSSLYPPRTHKPIVRRPKRGCPPHPTIPHCGSTATATTNCTSVILPPQVTNDQSTLPQKAECRPSPQRSTSPPPPQILLAPNIVSISVLLPLLL
jgi:hypothetical protein